MIPKPSRTLFIYLNIVNPPRRETQNTKKIVAKDFREVVECVLNAKGFSSVVIYNLIRSVNGAYVRLPFGQDEGPMASMLDCIRKKAGCEVGLYSFIKDDYVHWFVNTADFGPKRRRPNVYEIVVPSMKSFEACQAILEKHFGDYH
jgi:hypothetical protein